MLDKLRGHSVPQRLRAFAALPAGVRRRFLIMIAPWLLAFLAGFPILWVEFNAATQEPQWRGRENLLNESVEIVRRTLDSLQHDVTFLSDLSAQLGRTDVSEQSTLAKLFLNFAGSAGAFDQVRWLDEHGNERLRVNTDSGEPRLATQVELQNARSRPYFRETLGLPQGAIYLSELNLRAIGGIVQLPFEPTLRVATPLYDNGVSRGIIAINYRATRLLKRLTGLSKQQGQSAYLVNDQGYWLQGPTPQESWAWQLNAPESALKNTNPGLWKAMQRNDSGRYSDASGDWAFQRIKLAGNTSVDQNAAAPLVSQLHLSAVIHSSPEQAALASPRWKFVLALLMSVVVFFAIRYGWHTMNNLIEEDRQSRELHAANQALQQANDNLLSMQADLAHAERLSSLGLMVAGVAHELNTPLGSANLSLSTLQQTIATLTARLETGLRRSDLDSFLSSVQQASELTQAAVQRAARLVQRFKQVAVDRTTMEQREFDLAEIIMDSDPRLRNWNATQGISLQLNLQAGLSMSSYPGPLEQVIANLLGNALTHAFQGRSGGTLVIEACADEPNHAIIRVSDNGNGIADEHLERIFDPFFTTNRHAGGTGLGLHISSQLVTEVLGGTIKVQNIAVHGGTGAMFILRLPRQAPVHRPAPVEQA